jgi:O-antigen/teichoic acid export membrane protein
LARGGIQLKRNAIFAVAKLAFLPALVAAGSVHFGEPIIISWLGAVLVSLVVAYRSLGAVAAHDSWRPNFANLIAKRRLIWGHHWLNVAVLVPNLAAPVVVAAFVGPAANAGFYTAQLVVSFINVIPSQLSTALFALRTGDEQGLSTEVRASMRVCLLLSLGSGIVFVTLSHFILHVFRESYVSAAPAMAILGLTTLPSAVKAHYVAISRVRGQMARAAVRASLAAAGEVVGMLIGVKVDGVTGVALGLLAAYLLEAALFGATVLGVLRGPQPAGPAPG